MEYLDGQPLQQLVHRALAQSNRLPLRMHLGIMVDVLSALEHAHESTDFDGTPLGVVHRDVSPQNVIITYEGQTKLVDFGISKAAGATHETPAGVLQGKMRYMAPEQAAGRPVDRRADLFSVGAMLWEAIVGHRPWEGQSDGAVLQSLILGTVPRVRDAWPDVDPDLAAIVERAMSVDVVARYPTAGAMRADLERYIGNRNLTPTARSLGASVSRLFAEDRTNRRAVIDAQLRSLMPPGTEARGSSPSSRVPNGKVARPASREETLHSPTAGGPSSSPGSALSLPPPVAEPGGRFALLAGAGRSQSVMPIVAAVGFGVVLALAVVLADRFRAADWHVVAMGAAASVPPYTPVADAAPRKAHMSVSASPASARLYLDDAAVSNPYEADHVRDTTAHRLRVEAPGYETKTRAFTFADAIELEIGLSPDSPAPTLLPTPPAVAQHAAAVRPPEPPPPAPICEPPFIADSTGKRHWKLECLGAEPRAAASVEVPLGLPRPVIVKPKPIDVGSPY
jgi:serine/threonine-protein kinase